MNGLRQKQSTYRLDTLFFPLLYTRGLGRKKKSSIRLLLFCLILLSNEISIGLNEPTRTVPIFEVYEMIGGQKRRRRLGSTKTKQFKFYG